VQLPEAVDGRHTDEFCGRTPSYVGRTGKELELSRPGVLDIRGALGSSDVPQLRERVEALVDRGPVVCDLTGLGEVDAGTVDALARLQLAARRLGGRIVLRNVPGELQELLGFMGLADALVGGCPAPP